jgi:hypothetical protein
MKVTQDPGLRAMLLPLAGVVAGFVALALSWGGASRQLLLAAELPWVVSGAVTGIGLIGLSATLAAVTWRRRAVAREVVLLDQALHLVQELR